MAEWLYEAGIGEARAALIADGEIVEARIEVDDGAVRAGTVADARLTQILVPGRRGVARLDGAEEALVEPLAKGWTEGAAVRAEIVREAIPEPGNPKRAKARPSDSEPVAGPDLRARIAATGLPVVVQSAHMADALEAAGWGEILESATSGLVDFPGGQLRIEPTAAMTVIDIDGHLPPAELALSAAKASGRALRRFDITGSIAIDFPTLGNKAERQAVAEAFDVALPQPFERTAINGFGLMQVVRPRLRASLIETLRCDPAAAARALLRRAQRSGLIGATRLVTSPAVFAVLEARTEWLAQLGRELGGAVSLRSDAALAMSGGYAEQA